MKLEKLLKLLVEQKQSNSVDYLLMDLSQKLDEYDVIYYTVPVDFVMLVEIENKYVRVELMEIQREVDTVNDRVIDTLIVQNTEDRDYPANFSLDQDIPVKIFVPFVEK
jgi:hypothetical protein